jgi:hypothetical protein
MVSTSTSVNNSSGAISEEQVRWIADFNVMMTLGDGMVVSVVELAEIDGESVWRARVINSSTGHQTGELHIDPCTGQNVTWHPCK